MKSRHLFPLVYDALMTVAERAFLSRWRRSLIASLRGTVLEIGAGTGLDFPHYTGAVTAVATDPDETMLRRARRRAAGARATILLVAADAEALPFRDASFDGAVVALALCTIPEPANALSELRRVLSGGATVRLLEHVRASHRLISRCQQWLTPVWRRIAGGCRLDRDTARCVAESGLVIDHVDQHVAGIVIGITGHAPR
jgi:ubiquinone/menaquinone biosynthesis C-methylase UbiE